MKNVVVIGGGLGGLSTAVQLASKGWAVTLVEAQANLGGKLQLVEQDGYRFDRGASTITMPWVFEQVYRNCGVDPADYVEFYRVEPGAKNVFADGHVVHMQANLEKMADEIAVFSPADAKQLRAFFARSALYYDISEQQFLYKLMLRLRDKMKPSLLRAMVTIRPWESVERLLQRYFAHPNTIQLLARYATYVGSSPYQTPAVFSMMAHLEQQLGIWGVRGGTHALVRGFERLARELGVTILTSTRVEQIVVQDGITTGVCVRRLANVCGLRHSENTEFLAADVVVANADALTVYSKLIAEPHRPSMSNAKIAKVEPSLSGFVLLLGVRRRFEGLQHHNIWFPRDYAAEFEAIFQRQTAPDDPTLYICWNGYSEPNSAPEGCSNLFILVNAPYNNPNWNWHEEAANYRDKIIQLLEQKLGPFEADIEVEQRYHPGMLEADTGAYRGAIYGMSSNSFNQAFFRHANQSPDIRNLWFVGGSTHPGGGTPIVTLSGTLVAEAIANS
jgi:phytoene desaturase